KERRFFGTFDVDDDHSLRAAGDVRVRARDVDAARVGDRYASGDARVIRIGDVDARQSTARRDEGVAELHGDAGGLFQFRNRGHDARRERLVDVDDDETVLRTDEDPAAGDVDRTRAVQRAAGIERDCARKEVVRRIGVG